MPHMMNPLFMLIIWICNILFWVVITSVILSWLAAFSLINLRNPTMARLYTGINAFTDRLYTPIRKLIPTVFGGMDIAPVIFLIILQVIQYTLGWLSVTYGL